MAKLSKTRHFIPVIIIPSKVVNVLGRYLAGFCGRGLVKIDDNAIDDYQCYISDSQSRLSRKQCAFPIEKNNEFFGEAKKVACRIYGCQFC